MKNVIITTKAKPLVKINAEPQKKLSISAKAPKKVSIRGEEQKTIKKIKGEYENEKTFAITFQIYAAQPRDDQAPIISIIFNLGILRNTFNHIYKSRGAFRWLR